MATLYKTSENARKIIIVALAAVIVFLLIDTVGKVGEQVNKPPVEPARFYMNQNRKYGDIDRPKIPGIVLDSSVRPTYSLIGFWGSFPDISYVYKVEDLRERLLVFENAQESVELLGFNGANFKDNANGSYEWAAANSTKIINFNKIVQSWSLTTNYVNNIEARKRKTLSAETETYTRNMVRAISQLGFEVTGFEDPFLEARYAKLDNGVFVYKEDTDYQEADYVFVNAFKSLNQALLKPKNEQPTTTNPALIPKDKVGKVYSDDPRYGQVSMVVSNSFADYSKDIFEMKYKNFLYITSPGAYYIITPDEAWTKVQQGFGSLTLLLPQGSNYFEEFKKNIQVRKFEADRLKTELAFWEPSEWTGYVYPVYVFRGTAELADGRQANFIYYMEAIKRLD